jgi:hypothetical protein
MIDIAEILTFLLFVVILDSLFLYDKVVNLRFSLEFDSILVVSGNSPKSKSGRKNLEHIAWREISSDFARYLLLRANNQFSLMG